MVLALDGMIKNRQMDPFVVYRMKMPHRIIMIKKRFLHWNLLPIIRWKVVQINSNAVAVRDRDDMVLKIQAMNGLITNLEVAVVVLSVKGSMNRLRDRRKEEVASGRMLEVATVRRRIAVLRRAVAEAAVDEDAAATTETTALPGVKRDMKPLKKDEQNRRLTFEMNMQGTDVAKIFRENRSLRWNFGVVSRIAESSGSLRRRVLGDVAGVDLIVQIFRRDIKTFRLVSRIVIITAEASMPDSAVCTEFCVVKVGKIVEGGINLKGAKKVFSK